MLIRANLQNADIAIQFTIFMVATIGFSTVFHQYFEKPILSARPDYPRPSAADQGIGAPATAFPTAGARGSDS